MPLEKPLTPKMTRFVLVLASSPTITAAIKETGVAEATAYRWLKDERVKRELRDARREIMFHSVGKLISATGNAINVLTDVMNDDTQPAGSRVQAAKMILDTAINTVQADDLQEQIDALKKLKENN